MRVGRGPSLGHSAHVGHEVVVIHYRWHPLHGRQLRRHYGERRAEGDVVHVEVTPGIVTLVAAWMLDPAACAGMEVGSPRVAVSALADLHRLLTALGFRTDSKGDLIVALGAAMKPTQQKMPPPLCQMTMSLDGKNL